MWRCKISSVFSYATSWLTTLSNTTLHVVAPNEHESYKTDLGNIFKQCDVLFQSNFPEKGAVRLGTGEYRFLFMQIAFLALNWFIVYTLVTLPKSLKAIPAWRKSNTKVYSEDLTTRFNVLLKEKGFMHVERGNGSDLFPPVLRYSTLRSVFSLTAKSGREKLIRY